MFITLGVAAIFFSLAVAVFWDQDGRYSLPTSRPMGLRSIAPGETIALPAANFGPEDGRPVFLHFFNPDCPCSRFNAGHVRELRQRFGDRARFVAVVQTSADAREGALAATARLLGADLLAVVDADDGNSGTGSGAIAEACGVYSTPQAVLLGPGSELIFRGNYNVSRYCADPQTEFARLALETLLEGRPLPPAAREAMIAYSCELPAHAAAAAAVLPAARRL